MSVHWSPDDQWLSYSYTPTRTAGAIDYRIWLVTPNGATPHSVTSGRVDGSEDWISSTKLLFTKGTMGPPNIPEFYSVDLASGNTEPQITNNQSIRKYYPAIDRTHGVVVFAGEVGSLPERLFRMSLTGGAIDSLIPGNYWTELHPSWSPDGHRVYFTSSRSGHYEIWSVDVASRHLRQVTRAQVAGMNRYYGRPSPDGSRIAVLEISNRYDQASLQVLQFPN